MNPAHQKPEGYKAAGVDIAEADAGLRHIIDRITATWPASGIGAVQLPIGYFANVIDIGGIGLAIGTDGVGSKAIVAQMLNRYDTIGIDCVAMNVNDLLCVGARPLSMVDYIAVERADAGVLDAIAIGLAEGARQAGISITGGEISQLPDIVRGFDLVGTAIGTVPLDRIIVGRDLQPGDRVIGVHSNGLHSNGFTLTRRVFFEQARLSPHHVFPELGCELGEELLRPTLIYVPEILEIIELVPSVKALIHITGDGLLNLPRVDAAIGFVLDALPPPPAIFGLIERCGGISRTEMFEVYNMGIGFCIVVAEADVAATLAILARHNRQAAVIGHAIADPTKSVQLPQYQLIGQGKRFRPA
jgi:phosphoribosylformylglycinamidine cyclo-ligase